MIKAIVEKKGAVKLTVAGDVKTIFTELLRLNAEILKAIAKANGTKPSEEIVSLGQLLVLLGSREETKLDNGEI